MRFGCIMKDIKSLYLAAKNGSKSAINSYVEAVDNLILSPNDYLANSEYIINSDIGLATLNEFVDRYGLSISVFDDIMEKVDQCITKCDALKKNSSKYQEAKKYLESYKNKYRNCFEMYEYFADSLPSNYSNTYYSFNENGVQNNHLVGMISKFGEAAIPDMIITASKLGSNTMDTLFKYLENNQTYDSPTLYQWISECANDSGISEFSESISLKNIQSKNLTSIVNNMRSRNNQLFREAMIIGNEDAVYEYTETEVKAIEDLISFKEYKIACCESTEEAISVQKEIYSLYEEYDGIIPKEFNETIADSVIPMQPSSTNHIEEDTWVMNTHDKKTGGVPGYIAKNHDMAHYGEDDDKPESDDPKKTLEDYRRPSSRPQSDEEDDIEEIQPSVDNSKSLSKPSNLSNKSEDESDEDLTPKEKHAINNYYYYTYNNSLNKNSHSFNKDNSVHNRDDHSTDDHSVHDNHSTSNVTNKSTDDHSVNKHIRSHNNQTENDDVVTEESSKPWELNIFNNNFITEEVGDADDDKPKSDHPVKDVLTDIDRATVKYQQKAKKTVQNIQNAGRAFVKPIKRTEQWINNMVNNWKDVDETRIKEKLADPYARKNIFTAIKKAIEAGSLLKAGILINPVFLFLNVTKGIGNHKKEGRIRNEMIAELKTEIEICEEKIKDADRDDNHKAKYQLMRFKNELNKKLARAAGMKNW